MNFSGNRPSLRTWLRLWAEDLLEEKRTLLEETLADAHWLPFPSDSRLVAAAWERMSFELRSSVLLRRAMGIRRTPIRAPAEYPTRADFEEFTAITSPYVYQGAEGPESFADTLPDYFDMPLAVSDKELRRREARYPRVPLTYANITRITTGEQGNGVP